ncbi:MAG: hypothetical protein KDA25_01860 [Phycisphaerales bacterium]|nr:hypothetical protein [Phycisphaerales bacterium]
MTGAARTMPDALRMLMTHLVDYAGLFPPAKLDMATTVANYDAYLRHADAWMLGRLIVPVARLDEFEAAAATLLPTDDDLEPWLISALTRPADDDDGDALAADLERIDAFNERHAEAAGGLAGIDVIEVRASSGRAIDGALDAISDDLFPFFEIPVDADPRGLIATLAGSDAGAKIRTGGITADLFPTPEQVARFLAACAAAETPFKATAGLHHPLRHHSTAVGTEMFGFLNVFVAATLACIDSDRSASSLVPVLTETSIGAFAIDDAGIAWRDERLSVDDIESARERFAVSFGSCSFDDPREDLHALGFMPVPKP